MALRFERRHLTYRTWYHKRYEGGGGSSAACCFLLLSGPSDEFLLLQTGCLELLNCAPGAICCLLTEDDTDGTFVILTEDDVDGSSCIQPEDC